MRKIEVEELKKIQLDILKEVDKFCRVNKIDYSLAYGTLLGAVRHKGYIPWDDDIDIMMTRPNYEKFIHSFNGFYKHLYVISPELNWDFYAPYANVCDNRTYLSEGGNNHRGEMGIKIDVFPIDGVPTEYKAYNRMQREILWFEKYLWAKKDTPEACNMNGKIAWILYRLLSLFQSYGAIQRRIRKKAIACDYDGAEYCDNVLWDVTRSRCKKELYNKFTEIEFENETFMSVKDYDTYLSIRYGKYMELPPVEQRVTHHNFIAYWKD